MKSKIVILIIFAIQLLVGCGSNKVMFTGEAKSKIKLTELDMLGIQFYTSSELILHRGDYNGTKYIHKGDVIIKSKKNSDLVIIPKNTPCLLSEEIKSSTGNSILIINFEDNKDLAFGNEINDGGFYLMAKDWNGTTGKTKFGNETYSTDECSGRVYLKFKIKKYSKATNRELIIKGRRIN